MSKGVMTCLPPHDGHPGVEIIWAADCRDAFNQGVKLAQTWLDNARSGWLWAVMIAERDLLPCAIERRAFEVGFLSRSHGGVAVLRQDARHDLAVVHVHLAAVALDVDLLLHGLPKWPAKLRVHRGADKLSGSIVVRRTEEGFTFPAGIPNSRY